MSDRCENFSSEVTLAWEQHEIAGVDILLNWVPIWGVDTEHKMAAEATVYVNGNNLVSFQCFRNGRQPIGLTNVQEFLSVAKVVPQHKLNL
jgi:hypothetical protein